MSFLSTTRNIVGCSLFYRAVKQQYITDIASRPRSVFTCHFISYALRRRPQGLSFSSCNVGDVSIFVVGSPILLSASHFRHLRLPVLLPPLLRLSFLSPLLRLSFRPSSASSTSPPALLVARSSAASSRFPFREIIPKSVTMTINPNGLALAPQCLGLPRVQSDRGSCASLLASFTSPNACFRQSRGPEQSSPTLWRLLTYPVLVVFVDVSKSQLSLFALNPDASDMSNGERRTGTEHRRRPTPAGRAHNICTSDPCGRQRIPYGRFAVLFAPAQQTIIIHSIDLPILTHMYHQAGGY